MAFAAHGVFAHTQQMRQPSVGKTLALEYQHTCRIKCRFTLHLHFRLLRNQFVNL